MSSTLAAPRATIGSYRLLKPLREDGDDDWLAEDALSRDKVWLRLLKIPPARREVFLRDARMLTRLRDDFVVPILGAGESGDACWIVSEPLPGEPLLSRLHREHRLPLKETIRIGRETAAGLAAVHANGLIHRDVCPAHVWLEPSGRARLTGFGVASPDEGGSLLDRLDQAGTPGYLSPEQAAGEAITPSADLFALGCVLYQMATGESPFRGSTPVELLRAAILDHPPSARTINPEIPETLEALITRCLAKLPADRPASANAVELQLRELLDPTAAQQAPPPPPQFYPASRRILDALAEERRAPTPTTVRQEIVVAPPRPAERRHWFGDLVAGVLLTIGALGLYFWWKSSNTPPPAATSEPARR